MVFWSFKCLQASSCWKLSLPPFSKLDAWFGFRPALQRNWHLRFVPCSHAPCFASFPSLSRPASRIVCPSSIRVSYRHQSLPRHRPPYRLNQWIRWPRPSGPRHCPRCLPRCCALRSNLLPLQKPNGPNAWAGLPHQSADLLRVLLRPASWCHLPWPR